MPQFVKVTRMKGNDPIVGNSAALGLPIRLERAHPPTFKQKDEKPDLFVLVFIQQIKTSPSKERHQRIIIKSLH